MINFKVKARNILRSIRTENDSNLFWWQGPPYNFGDWIGPYLFSKITGRDPHHKTPSNKSFSTVYLTVGSLARWFCQDSIVWGSGIIEKDEWMWEPFQTKAVRGLYTRNRMHELDYECPNVYGDPAILLSKFFSPKKQELYRVGIVPHYSNYEEAVDLFKNKSDVLVVDVRKTVELVIEDICSCKAIVSSSLHGLIIGNTYSIPCAHVFFSQKPGGDGIKYLDYFSAYGVTPPEGVSIHNYHTLDDIEYMIGDYPQPTTENNARLLLQSCPFANPSI